MARARSGGTSEDAKNASSVLGPWSRATSTCSPPVQRKALATLR